MEGTIKTNITIKRIAAILSAVMLLAVSNTVRIGGHAVGEISASAAQTYAKVRDIPEGLPDGSVYVPFFGDLDGDKTIAAGDALIVLRASVDPEGLSERDFLLADVDGDELITANDVLLVLRSSVSV